jgi:hypothetical protein
MSKQAALAPISQSLVAQNQNIADADRLRAPESAETDGDDKTGSSGPPDPPDPPPPEK